MADLEINSDSLVVHIRGLDQFFALATRLEVALAHISRVEVNPAEAHRVWHGLRMGGTNLPGLITAGRFLQGGEWAFWDVHDPERAIAIYLSDERYARLMIGVDDPEAVGRALAAAINKSA